MKRHILSSILLFALLLTACGRSAQPGSQSAKQSQPADASSETGKIVFTDALGQEYREVLAAYAADENGTIDRVE